VITDAPAHRCIAAASRPQPSASPVDCPPAHGAERRAPTRSAKLHPACRRSTIRRRRPLCTGLTGIRVVFQTFGVDRIASLPWLKRCSDWKTVSGTNGPVCMMISRHASCRGATCPTCCVRLVSGRKRSGRHVAGSATGDASTTATSRTGR
jgi:hypothetical protein